MHRATPLLLTAVFALSACDPVTLGLVTTGGGLALNHQLSGTVARTFSEDPATLHQAVQGALGRMSIEISKDGQDGPAEVIEGVAGTRTVSLRIEPVTRSSTQLSVTVHRDLLTVDAATGREIVAQTEQAMATLLARKGSGASLAGTAPGATTAAATNGGSSGKTTYYGRDTPESKSPAATRVTIAAAQRPRPASTGTSGALPGQGPETAGTR